MLTLLIALATTAALPDAVAHDLAAYSAEDQLYLHYLDFSHVTSEKQRTAWVKVAQFVVPSCSKEVVLERQIPYQLPGTGYCRIDLRGLGWDRKDLAKVLEDYPYAVVQKGRTLRVIRGDWLVVQLSDPTESDAYYRMLYGGDKIPKTRDEFLAFWKVVKDSEHDLEHGWIEGQSHVSKALIRRITHFEKEGGSAWGTEDSLKITSDTDPLRDPARPIQADPNWKLKHDGEEWIVLIPKTSLKHRLTGALQVYLLSDGNGKVVQEAPVELVEDTSRFRNQTAVITFGGCVQCHVQGSLYPTENMIREKITAGDELKAKDYDAKELIERFHLTDEYRQLNRDREDYVAAVFACNGLTGAQNVAHFKYAIREYDKPLTLEVAAAEKKCKPEELRNAIAYASEQGIEVGPLLTALPRGKTVPRTQWEEDALRVDAYLSGWRRAQK